MRVKVLLRALEDETKSKIEYFNDVDAWYVESGILHLVKQATPGAFEKKVASINYWIWVKEDE